MKRIVIAALVILCAAAAFADEAGGGSVDDRLLGRWRWTGVTLGADVVETEQNAGNYLLTLNADGSMEIIADCRRGGGSYTADGGMLTLIVNSMTKMTCEIGSLADDFGKLLMDVGSFEYVAGADNKLILTFAAGTGKAEFIKAQEAK